MSVLAAKTRKNAMPLLLLLPAVASVVLSMGYPLYRQVIMSFQNFGLAQQFGAAPEWVGLSNFTSALSSGDFWAVVYRSVVFCLVCATITMIIGVGGALLLTKVNRVLSSFVQVVMLVAWAMPVLSSLQVFNWLFSQRSGVTNWFLVQLGFTEMAGYNWLNHQLSFFVVAGAQVTWMSVPLVVFMVYAAVTQIDESMMEAAEIDGASSWQRFTQIIVPSIAPILVLVSLLEIIWDFRVFTQVFVLQKGTGITSETNVLGTYVYQVGMSGSNYGMASAMALIMLVMSLAITAWYILRLMKQGEN